jgi:hypothetical protein
MTPRNPTRLDRSSATGPFPTGRYAGPAPFPSGEGERTLPEQMVGWSYKINEGFQMIDFPLGNPAPESLSRGLAANDFRTTPSRVVGTGPHRIEVYDRQTTAEFLVIVFSDCLEQLVIAKGFPSMMDLLRQWGPVVEKCSGDHGGGGTERPPEAAGLNAAGDRYSILIGDAVAAKGLTLAQACRLKPKATPGGACVITKEGSPVALYVWDESEQEWRSTPAVTTPPKARTDSGPRYRVVTPDRRLIADGKTLTEVMKMDAMPHDCHGAAAYLIGAPQGAKPVLVYNQIVNRWAEPD